MSEADAVAQATTASRLGFKNGDLIQEFGYDEDVDFDFRADLEDVVGSELLDEDDQEVVDGVLLWWRDGDGDLVDALVDVLPSLEDEGIVWLLTPKQGRPGFVAAVEIQQAAPVAGLHSTSTLSTTPDWTASRLVSRKKK